MGRIRDGARARSRRGSRKGRPCGGHEVRGQQPSRLQLRLLPAGRVLRHRRRRRLRPLRRASRRPRVHLGAELRLVSAERGVPSRLAGADGRTCGEVQAGPSLVRLRHRSPAEGPDLGGQSLRAAAQALPSLLLQPRPGVGQDRCRQLQVPSYARERRGARSGARGSPGCERNSGRRTRRSASPLGAM